MNKKNSVPEQTAYKATKSLVFFKKWPLKKRLFFLLGLFTGLLAVNGLIGMYGVQKVYKHSHPLAISTYPAAKAITNALHAHEFARALAIQYALEQDPAKLRLLRKHFEIEFKNANTQLAKISLLSSLPAELTSNWKRFEKVQKRFFNVSQLLMEAHDAQLKLAVERFDQIRDANRLVEALLDQLGRVFKRYSRSQQVQLWNIAAQVLLLEQRYLYQPAMTSPLLLTPEQSTIAEKKLNVQKDSFRNYVQEFKRTMGHITKVVSKKDRLKMIEIRKMYDQFQDHVEGENGVFLISEDEIAKLGSVGLQLEVLEKIHAESAETGKEVQNFVGKQMEAASAAISTLRRGSYSIILVFTALFMGVCLFIGSIIVRGILLPVSHLTRASKLVKAGHLTERVQVFGEDELGDLTESFNQMIEMIQTSMEKIKGMNVDLESKIKERTQELASVNVRLMEANETKSEYLSNISHDLKTPLNSIIAFTQMVLTEGSKNLKPQQAKNLNTVIRNGKDLLKHINLILDYSKTETGKLEINIEEFSFESLLDECLESTEILINTGQVNLLKEVQTHLPKLNTDRPKVKRILLNLLSNAAKFTKNGTIKVSARRMKSILEFSVEDTGEGIEPTLLIDLFESYKTDYKGMTKKGTGLGLTISKQLANVLQGTIRVHSSVGKGSVFTVKIPFLYEKQFSEVSIKAA